MNNYFISKDNKNGEIVYLEYDKEGYKVTPKRKKEDAAKIQELFDTSVFDLPWDSMSVGDKPDTGMILKKSKKLIIVL